jgi:hypothetical protein
MVAKKAAKKEEALEVVEFPAAAMAVTDAPSYRAVVEGRQDAKDYIDRVEAYFGPLKAKAHEVHRDICAKENEAKAGAVAYLKAANRALTAYEVEQRKLQEQAEEEAQAELERQAEKKRLKMQKRLQKAGYSEEAAKVASETVEVGVAVVEPTHESALSLSQSWKGEVNDLWSLVKFLGTKQGKPFLYLVEPVMPKIHKLVQANKGKLDLPGVRAIQDHSIRDRRK